jgi:hypothetical protein
MSLTNAYDHKISPMALIKGKRITYPLTPASPPTPPPKKPEKRAPK